MQSNERRNGPQYENAAMAERLDSIVYGFLRRQGYNEAANGLERESPFLCSSLHRSQNRQFVTINDRIHDHTLEELVQLFCQDGRFGVNQNLLEFGEELRRLTNRFTSITSQNAPGRSSLHQQLYGRPAFSRQQNSQNYTLSMAPQAKAQLELQHINQIAEQRYKQQQQRQVADIPPSAPQVLPQATTPVQMPIYEEMAHASQSAEGSSRRKLHQPQSLNTMVQQTVIEPLVGLINERPWNDVNDIRIDDGTIFHGLDVIGKDFLATFDYNPDQEIIQVDQEFDTGFENFMQDEPIEQSRHFDVASLPVEEEIVVEKTKEKMMTPVQPTHRFPNPSPLLSPLPKEMQFGKNSAERPSEPPLQKPQLEPRRREFPVVMEKRSNGENVDIRRDERRYDNSPRRTNSETRKVEEKKRQKDKTDLSDRESGTSSSSSSRQPISTEPSKKDIERRRKEREQRKEAERLKMQAKSASSSPATHFSSKQGSDLLNKVRKAHAVTKSGESTDPNSALKRKADDSVRGKDFKIPKKASKNEGKVPSVVPKPMKTNSSSKNNVPFLDEGVDRPDSTHFLVPRCHIARLSLMLVNSDKQYEEAQRKLKQRKEAEEEFSDASLSPPVSAKSVESGTSGESVSAHPKARNIAPQKGFMLTSQRPNTSPTTESSAEEDTENEEYLEDESMKKRSVRVDRTIDLEAATAVLDRIHGPEH